MAQTRITAGDYRGRVLAMPPGRGTRPTTGRVREALFNILGRDIRGGIVVDLFAGAGTIGFEALSRGAAGVTFVERDPSAVEAIAATAHALGCAGRCRIVRADVSGWLPEAAAEVAGSDLCYLDAPYLDDTVDGVMEVLGDRPPRLVVCEHHRARHLADRIGGMERAREARYGLARLSFYRPSAGLGNAGEQQG